MSDLHSIDLSEAAELQDNLLMAANDLERLGTLLDDCHAQLQSGFFATLERLQALRGAGGETPALATAIDGLLRTAKALQFQDMSNQLIAHTRQRLRHCADRLALDAFGADDDGAAVVEAAPQRPNPVTQSEMDTGFIELF